MSKRYLTIWVVCLELILGTAAVSNASTIALDFSAQNPFGAASFSNVGWEFAVNSAITVDGLGVFDYDSIDGSGFANNHQVGLWNSVGALLASTTVTSGSALVLSASAAGDWRFEDITPLLLLPGDYVLGAFYPSSSDVVAADAVISTIPEITYLTSRAGAVGAFGEPDPYGAVPPGVFGPDLRVADETTVPEPATLLLVATGAALAGARRRRVARRAS